MVSWEEAIKSSVNNMVLKIKNDADLYNWFINFEPDSNEGYMWTSHPNIKKISELVSSDGHSGASFAICLRETKKILINEIQE